jgi:uncharacterized integral membrane protein
MHRIGAGWTLALLVLLVIILQNVEPVAIDVLFWSLPAVPKLVLIGTSMLIGALLGEAVRWSLRHSRNAELPPRDVGAERDGTRAPY